MQQEVANRIHAEQIYHIICIDYISTGLTHLSITLDEPRMSEHLLRKRLAKRHEDTWPVNGMETDDILADQMQICRPVTMVQFVRIAIHIIAKTCDIVGQRVDPYIYDMSRIKIYRNTPFEGCS